MKWSVAIFSSREDPSTFIGTVDASVVAAARADQAFIDVVVNGNRALAEEAGCVLMPFARHSRGRVRCPVWHVELGDKAHAWNEYVHRIWPDAEIAYFVDGYAQVFPDAFELINNGLQSTPKALA